MELDISGAQDAAFQPSGQTSACSAVKIFQKRFFSITELCRITGFTSTSIRFWEPRYPKLRPSIVCKGRRRRYRASQMVLFVALHLLIDDMGLTMEGAYRVMEEADLDRLVQSKEDTGDPWLTTEDLQALIRQQINMRLSKVIARASARDA